MCCQTQWKTFFAALKSSTKKCYFLYYFFVFDFIFCSSFVCVQGQFWFTQWILFNIVTVSSSFFATMLLIFHKCQRTKSTASQRYPSNTMFSSLFLLWQIREKIFFALWKWCEKKTTTSILTSAVFFAHNWLLQTTKKSFKSFTPKLHK